MESILTSVKKMLGITEEYTHFDADIIIHINTVFVILTQMGIGPKEGFSIIDEHATWSDFTSDIKDLEAVKTYVYLKVKLIFDPPTSSIVLDANKRMLDELEWRLHVACDTKTDITEVVE